eukprot:TRINITY_DN5018_c0_g1_i1.p2 TRINITY_DN5018_c0_g1~~TRINITY_DN5018_c0_g1_i1.p2  ORF type:complete len:119 (-),score=25.37 TRINITY_DN5018_c0_g1_i1:438-794(-)
MMKITLVFLTLTILAAVANAANCDGPTKTLCLQSHQKGAHGCVWCGNSELSGACKQYSSNACPLPFGLFCSNNCNGAECCTDNNNCAVTACQSGDAASLGISILLTLGLAAAAVAITL